MLNTFALHKHIEQEYFISMLLLFPRCAGLSVPLLFLTHRLWSIIGVSPGGDRLCGLSGTRSAFWRLTLTQLIET